MICVTSRAKTVPCELLIWLVFDWPSTPVIFRSFLEKCGLRLAKAVCLSTALGRPCSSRIGEEDVSCLVALNQCGRNTLEECF